MIRNLTLTQRAMLTFAGNLVVQIAEFLTGFFISPFIIRGLGSQLYGAWGMLQQILGYFSLTELRATNSLRFLLSLQQHRESNSDEKQRLIGSTLVLMALSFPFTIALGLGLIWFLPNIIRIEPNYTAGLRIALIILLVNAVLDRILAIPMHILKAQNIDYAGMGINTAMVLTGSLLSGLAIWLGYGLPGLAAATMANVLLISIGRFWVARRFIPWMAFKKPSRDEFLRFLRTSGLLFVSGLASLLLYSTDTLLVGFMLGPAIAATYATSGVVLRMIGEPLYQIIGAGNAGLIGLCGQGDWARVANIRKEMYFILLFSMTVLGTGVIALNGPFLKLWLGAEFFGGNLLTLLLVISIILTFLARIDFTITNAMLFLREQTWALFCAGIAALSIGFILLKVIGIGGMALGMTIGNLVLLSFAWKLIQRRMPTYSSRLAKDLVIPGISIITLFGFAYLAGTQIKINSWISFAGYGIAIGTVASLIGWFWVLTGDVRKTLFNRIKNNVPLQKYTKKR